MWIWAEETPEGSNVVLAFPLCELYHKLVLHIGFKWVLATPGPNTPGVPKTQLKLLKPSWSLSSVIPPKIYVSLKYSCCSLIRHLWKYLKLFLTLWTVAEDPTETPWHSYKCHWKPLKIPWNTIIWFIWEKKCGRMSRKCHGRYLKKNFKQNLCNYRIWKNAPKINIRLILAVVNCWILVGSTLSLKKFW